MNEVHYNNRSGCGYYGSNDATLKKSAINVRVKKYFKLKKTILFVVLRFGNLEQLKLNKNGIFLNCSTSIVN
jgi:hypothetical protein